MTGFSAEWLALRERHDIAARNPDVLAAVTASLESAPSVHVTDLACGAGSTLRTLHARLPAQQHWDLIDNDPALLAIAGRTSVPEDIELNTVQFDLSRDLDTALDRKTNLITISALLDLVSLAWLDRFLRQVAVRALPVYAALTYDGRVDLSPIDPFDTAMIAAVNAHQRTDKGFGPALGPTAAQAAIGGFEAQGYAIIQGQSDWMIGPNDHAMQIELLAGWAGTAREMGTLSDADITGWLTRRKAAVSQKPSSIRVGHVDVFATPRAMR